MQDLTPTAAQDLTPTAAALALFFAVAVLGYDPQRGQVRRTKRPG